MEPHLVHCPTCDSLTDINNITFDMTTSEGRRARYLVESGQTKIIHDYKESKKLTPEDLRRMGIYGKLDN